jgi:hypothetical protein
MALGHNWLSALALLCIGAAIAIVGHHLLKRPPLSLGVNLGLV